MPDISRELIQLLDISQTPALAAVDDRIEYMNLKARESFSQFISPGDDISLIFGGGIGEDWGGRFMCVSDIGEAAVTVSASRIGNALVMFLYPEEGKREQFQNFSANVRQAAGSAMSVMKMAADQLVERLDTERDEKMRAYSAALYHSYYKLLRMIGNISDMGGLTDASYPLVPESINLSEFCYELVSSVNKLIPHTGTAIEYSQSGSGFEINADRVLIERMLLNLISNSLENSRPGDRVKLSLKLLGDRVIIAVDDTGRSLSEKDMADILTGYERKRSPEEISAGGGIGLGLSIAGGIARLHGGTLIITPGEEKGTSVRVLLPRNGDLPAKFKTSMPDYRDRGMHTLLTELSGVLKSDSYSKKYMD